MPEAVRAAVLAESPQFNSERAVAIDRILRSTEQLRASNQAKYLQTA